MMAPVRIPFTRLEVGMLRTMLRIMMLHRLFDNIGAARGAPKEEVPDNRVLHDQLKFIDLWHSHDHLLWKFQENVPGEKEEDEVAITMHENAIDFYRDILTYNFTPAGIEGGVLYTKMIAWAVQHQVPILKKLNEAVNKAEMQTVPINVFRKETPTC